MQTTDSVAVSESHALNSAYQYCEQIARRSGSSFFCAFLSLPREMFRQMCVIYAFMRITDDIGDVESETLEKRQANLAEWKAKLSLAFDSGDTEDPALLALVDVATKKDIPKELFFEVIAGVESDLCPRRIESFTDLQAYCYQVAGVVGLCCLKIWGCSGDESEQLAIDCGTAFQLTNILRDLGEDADRDRLYLPCEDLDQYGVTLEGIKFRRISEPFRKLMQFEVDRAWSFYEKSVPLINLVTPHGKKILTGFFSAYSSLLHQIERRNFDVFSKRIRLSRWKKSSIAMNSLLGRPTRFNIKSPSQLSD